MPARPLALPAAAAAFLSVVVPALAQTPLAAPATELLSLRTGTQWNYVVTETPGARKARTHNAVVTCEATATLADGTRIAQVREERDGATTTFAWFAMGDDGVHRLFARDAARRAAFDLDAARMHWLVPMPTAGASWTWTGRHDVATDSQGRPFTHTATCKGTEVRITTPAGAFATTHVHIDSAIDGHKKCARDLWFAPGTGLVRELHRDATRTLHRELVACTAAPDDHARLRDFIAKELASPATPAWNNPPALRWLEEGPELLLVPGRVAVAEGETGSRLYYVGARDVVCFQVRSGDDAMLASREVFGSDTAIPPESVPARDLALLLARAEAGRLGMERVHEVPVSLRPRRDLPQDSHRQAAVQVAGGARDGTNRHVAVWLTIRALTDLQVANDLEAKPVK